MKNKLAFTILAIGVLIGTAIGVYFLKNHQLEARAELLELEAERQSEMLSTLQDVHKNFKLLNNPEYAQPFVKSLIDRGLVELRFMDFHKDSSALRKINKIIVEDYVAHLDLKLENKRLKKLLENYENQRFSPCNVFTVDFPTIMYEMHEAEKITKEDLSTYKIPYTYTIKNKHDNYFITDNFNGNKHLVIVQNWKEHRLLAYLILNKNDAPILVFSSTIKGDAYCGVQSKIFENDVIEIKEHNCDQSKETITYHQIK
ncbi:hypothetical protein HSX10_12690 [Winogradskyella undariae]|uniref:hypothetical protein n=1 Tax=Winogradskyella undariae TaxID=1285465 RepID=UPI00156B7A95|nr:hypothetical protein [Winogradskyella undariae]NRR92427.1 hypothetical protein [Winogradskyella undariae]